MSFKKSKHVVPIHVFPIKLSDLCNDLAEYGIAIVETTRTHADVVYREAAMAFERIFGSASDEAGVAHVAYPIDDLDWANVFLHTGSEHTNLRNVGQMACLAMLQWKAAGSPAVFYAKCVVPDHVVSVPKFDHNLFTMGADPKAKVPRILVGTASWTDTSLIKSKLFYPPEAKSPEERLRYYAPQFPIVEVDSSYYAMPSAANAEKWAERAPDDFVFNIKAFRLLTGHQTPQASLPKDIQGELALHFIEKKNLYYKDTPAEIRDEMWRRYELGIRPLKEAGKLGAVHFQFPHWVRPAKATVAHIEECVRRLPDYQLAVEFRSSGWFEGSREQETLDWLTELGVVHVIVDEPQNIAAKSAPPVWATTRSDLAIVRLHGRNEEKWDIKGASAAYNRFDYDYTDKELDGLARDIESIAQAAGEVHVIFNNNFEDQGVRNAKTMIHRLR